MYAIVYVIISLIAYIEDYLHLHHACMIFVILHDSAYKEDNVKSAE